MKLKDLIKKDIDCFFEIDGVKYAWTGIVLYSYDKLYKFAFLERNLMGINFYETIREKQVKIIKRFHLLENIKKKGK